MAYNSVLKRDDLYFTPMMMVDGRHPMLGSNRPAAVKAIKEALATSPGFRSNSPSTLLEATPTGP